MSNALLSPSNGNARLLGQYSRETEREKTENKREPQRTKDPKFKSLILHSLCQCCSLFFVSLTFTLCLSTRSCQWWCYRGLSRTWHGEFGHLLFTEASRASIEKNNQIILGWRYYNIYIYALTDAFIQSDLQCIQVIHVLSVCVFPGNRTHNLCAANAMLYHWATGTQSPLGINLL